MSLTSGYDVTIYDPGTSTTYNFLVDRASYNCRLSNAAVPRAGAGGEYAQGLTADVSFSDDFRGGVGKDKWGAGLVAAYGVDGQGSHRLVLAPAETAVGALAYPVWFIAPYVSAGGGCRVYVGHGTDSKAVVSVFDPVSNSFSPVGTFTGTIPTMDAEVFKAHLYVVLGMSTTARRYNGTSWEALGWYACLLKRCGNYLWRTTYSGTPTQWCVSKSSDGTTWDVDIPVGLASTPINALAVMGGELYIAKPEGLFKITNNTDCIEVVQFPLHDQSAGKGMIAWNDVLYIPLGSSILRYTGSTITDIAPGGRRDVSGVPAFPLPEDWPYPPERANVPELRWGKVTGLAGGLGNLYAFVARGGSAYLYATTGVSWHCWRKFPYLTNNFPALTPLCHASGLANALDRRILFVGYCNDVGNGGKVDVYDLPPTTDSVAYYPLIRQSEGYAFFPFFDAGLPRMQKNWTGITVLNHVPQGCAIYVGYRTSDEVEPDVGAFTWLDTAIGPGKPDCTVPLANLSGSFPASRRVQVALKLTRTTPNNATPVVHGVGINYIPYTIDRIRSFSFRIRAGGRVTKVGGGEQYLDAESALEQLLRLASAQYPLVYSDFAGTADAKVNITNVTPQVLRSRDGTNSEMWIAVSVLEVYKGFGETRQ